MRTLNGQKLDSGHKAIYDDMVVLTLIMLLTVCAASYSQKLLLFDALEGMFRVIKLRPRQSHCAVCGDNPTITHLQDYELFCGSRADDKERNLKLLEPTERISCSVSFNRV